MPMWNPWRGCRKCSEGCRYCYIHLAAPQFFCRSLPNSPHKTRIICYNGIQKIFPPWEQSPARRRLSNIPRARPPAFSRGRGGKKQKL